MKFVLWSVLILFITVGAGITYLAFLPTGMEMRSIENGGYMSLWGDHTNMGQIDAFGFNLKDRYETKYLMGVEDGFSDRVSIHIYQVKDEHIEPIRKLFKSHNKYSANKDFSPLCHNNRYSEKTIEDGKAYSNAHCKKKKTHSADCVVFSTLSTDDYKN
jgi:hypothetical protein